MQEQLFHPFYRIFCISGIFNCLNMQQAFEDDAKLQYKERSTYRLIYAFQDCGAHEIVLGCLSIVPKQVLCKQVLWPSVCFGRCLMGTMRFVEER